MRPGPVGVQSVHFVSSTLFQLLTCVVDVNYDARVKYVVGQGFYMLGNREPNSSYPKAHYQTKIIFLWKYPCPGG